MRFTQGRRRAAPSVIIVSLIDVLLVVLIFLMVSTTTRQTPAVKLALPEARHSEKEGASSDTLVVTIAKTEPYLYVGKRPVTFDKLQEELINQVKANSNLVLTLQADEGAPWGQVVRVRDAAVGARIRVINAVTRSPGGG
jgi:biopolymer transport protein ExbD